MTLIMSHKVTHQRRKRVAAKGKEKIRARERERERQREGRHDGAACHYNGREEFRVPVCRDGCRDASS